MYFEDGDDLLLVASKGGDPKHPAWYLNLVANPEVAVQVGREKLPLRAVTASEERKVEALATSCENVQGVRGLSEQDRPQDSSSDSKEAAGCLILLWARGSPPRCGPGQQYLVLTK